MSYSARQRRRRRRKGSPLKRGLVIAVVGSLIGLGAGALAAVGWVVSVANSAPNISQLKPQDPGGSSEVFAANGTPLGYIQSTVLRTVIPDAGIPDVLRRATVAIEDRRFYQHRGVDYQGVLRAAVRDVFGSGSSIQGGSTLTMQLVRNLYLPRSFAETKTIKRKIIEAKLAQELEKRQTKAWILDQYLNDVDYGTLGGQSAYGVGAASEMYFNKPVTRLNLAQVALLAGLPQAPSAYNPFLNPRLARGRRHDVLKAMVQAHDIPRPEAVAADHSPLQIHHGLLYNTKLQPYFFDYVHRALVDHYCPRTPAGCPLVDRGGLKIYTTLDLKRQQAAKAAIQANEGNPGDPAAALVTIDPSNGHIVAMASSAAYDKTVFNYAAQNHRQTGSAFKPFVLMAAIHYLNVDPNQTYYDSHELLPGWLPAAPTYHVQTSEHSYLGTINLAKAMALSDNTVYAQLDADVTPEKVTEMAHAMGITSHLDSFPAEGIGGLRTGVSALEMADAYATLANGGTHVSPTAVIRVVFPNGHVDNFGDPTHTPVFTDGEAAVATDVLKQVIQYGTGTAANFGCPAAGKTGTTSNYTDAWFVGYTPKLSTAVWVGYPKTTISMNDVNGLGPGFGGTLAAPIWHDYMVKAAGSFCGDFPSPSHPFQGTALQARYTAGGSGDTGGGNGGSFDNSTSTNGTSTGASTTATTRTSPATGTGTTTAGGGSGSGAGRTTAGNGAGGGSSNGAVGAGSGGAGLGH